jgi:hypothetical protein
VSQEEGSAPVWFLGLALCVLMLGAVSSELWRLIGERQELSSIADAAAVAAAGAVDLELYRSTGDVRLLPDQARALAWAVIDAHSGGEDLSSPALVEVAENRLSVRVALVREVEFGLVRILALEGEAFTVTAGAVAYPSVP